MAQRTLHKLRAPLHRIPRGNGIHQCIKQPAQVLLSQACGGTCLACECSTQALRCHYSSMVIRRSLRPLYRRKTELKKPEPPTYGVLQETLLNGISFEKTEPGREKAWLVSSIIISSFFLLLSVVSFSLESTLSLWGKQQSVGSTKQ